METGFDRSNTLLFTVNSDHAALGGESLRARFLLDLRSISGVASASYGMSAIGPSGWSGSVNVEGYTFAPDENNVVLLNAIEPEYFKTLRAPIVAGREFGPRDSNDTSKVAIINETFARRYFAHSPALGKWVNLAGEGRREIIGVVKDIKLRSNRQEVQPALYIALTQRRDPMWGTYVVRGSVNRAMIDTALQRIDPNLRSGEVRTLDEDLSRGILKERMMGALSSFFGLLSLLLVTVGIYGVMAFQVERRQKEIGIRMALGARPVEVIRMVLADTTLPVGVGVVAGIAGALALTRLLEKMLFGVKPTDPITFAGACGLLVSLALMAAYLPGRRAARLSPVETLRCE
jgi:predicted permease